VYSSPLDPGPIAPLTPDDLVSLLKGALAFAIFTLLFLFAGVLLHFVPRIRWPSLKKHLRRRLRRGLKMVRDTGPVRGFLPADVSFRLGQR